MNNPSVNIDEPMPFATNEKFDLIISYMKSANMDPEILENILKNVGTSQSGGTIMFGVFVREFP